MLRTIVAKEILNNLLNYRFMLAFVLCTALLVSSAGVQYADYLARKHDHETNVNYYRGLSSARHRAGWLYFESLFVSRAPQLLSVFATGVERDAATTANISPIHPPDLKSELHRNPLRSYFPSMDALFVVGIVLSLLIFVLTFDTLSGERTEGTLKVLMAGPVPRDTVFFAKWIGGMVCLVTPLVASMLLMAIVVLFSGTTTIPSGDWWRMATMAGVCVLYVAVVFSLAMMVSAISRRAGPAMLVLLALWAVFVVAIPALSTPLSYLVTDPVSPEQTETLNHRDFVGLVESPYFDECEEQEQKAHDLEAVPEGLARWQLLRKISALCDGRHMWPLYLDTLRGADNVRARATHSVEQLSRWISRLSPYGCLQNVCLAIAGTGPQREESVRQALFAYQKAQAEYYVEQLDRSPDGRVSGAASPVFRVRQGRLGTDLSHVAVDIAVLVLSGILFLMTGYAVFLRSEIA